MSNNFTHYREFMPNKAKEICDVIGILPTISLVQKFGGQTIYIAQKSNALSHMHLVECIGEKAATLLSNHVSGDLLTIPICTKVLRAKRNDELRVEFDQLTSGGKISARQAVKKLARDFEPPLHERSVWRILKSANG